MKLDTFINRPVLSTVISILIVILGAIGLVSLPITQYPDIAPPTVMVSATYPGANAQTVLNSVVAPLEDQINGVENMMYMSSEASNNGMGNISIYFKQGTDPDMAAVNACRGNKDWCHDTEASELYVDHLLPFGCRGSLHYGVHRELCEDQLDSGGTACIRCG